ncbi:ABC transporter ATP-binding protein [Bacillus haynesii]|uniref:ABC transporter ATP-binding protein n=1 Tax=Bacillus haynesii TaxID=1925021 RepID=UPI002281B800|nr:ABC transporter ATP-binding protein [Bacillus haynesii]MCY8005446.1 ABC transporter ATP-binding protein [Bacillus haynesii]
MTEVIATIKNLTKRINHKDIIKNLNFDIRRGEILGFLGPNGAGKTTTMRMIVGLMSITEGDIQINDYSIKKDKEKALQQVGGIIENPEMYKFLSGYDNLVHFQRMTGPVDKQKIQELTHLVGLQKVIKNKVKTYSLGMQQRLGIAQALLNSPDLLVLDEPTNGLDPSGIHEIRDYLRRICKEKNIGIFVSSHLLAEMELLCDRFIIIQNGNITDIEDVNQKDIDDECITFLLHVSPKEDAVYLLRNLQIHVKEDNNDVMIDVPYYRMPNIITELVKKQIRIYSIVPIKQSLEERFLAKTQGGN